MAAAIKSPAVHFALFCSIKDKDNKVIHSPMPNILQLRMSEAFETIKELGLRVRIIITKPRRAGCSSFVEHIGHKDAGYSTNRKNAESNAHTLSENNGVKARIAELRAEDEGSRAQNEGSEAD